MHPLFIAKTNAAVAVPAAATANPTLTQSCVKTAVAINAAVIAKKIMVDFFILFAYNKDWAEGLAPVFPEPPPCRLPLPSMLVGLLGGGFSLPGDRDDQRDCSDNVGVHRAKNAYPILIQAFTS